MDLIILIIAWCGVGGLVCLALAAAARRALPQPERAVAFLVAGTRAQAVSTANTGSFARQQLQRTGTLCVLAAMAMPLEAGQNLALQWDPSGDNTVTGYRVYYHDVGSTNVISVDAAANTRFTITNLAEAVTYSFYVTAYNAMGLESDPSNIVEFTVPLGRLATTLTSDAFGRAVMTFSIEPAPGKHVALQSSTNLTDWVMVATSDVDQPLSCQVTNFSGDLTRFYRSMALP